MRPLLKLILKQITPPIFWKVLRPLLARLRAKHPAEWEYVPQGWQASQTDRKIKGWNTESILTSYISRWPLFIESLNGNGPFGLSPESPIPTRPDLSFHNTLMSFAYVLTLCARQRQTLSMLDWGGGIGHYYLFSKTLVPDLQIAYSCKDVPILADYGQSLFPEARFYSDESCFFQKYDFVLASTSLHYSQNWKDVLTRLASVTSGFLFITRLPTTPKANSYVFVQRPYQYGYDTEYLGWCLNHTEFLNIAADAGLQLIREFLIDESPPILNAPGPCEYRGFLFRPAGQSA